MAGQTNYQKLHKRFVEKQSRQAEMDDNRWWKPPIPQVGNPAETHRIRILPPPDGFDSWYFEFGVHYGVKNEAGQFLTITCPLKTVQKPCPICEFTKGLWKENTEEGKTLARKIGVKTRYASNVIVLSNPAEVKLWSYGPKVWTPLNELCIGDNGEFNPIDSPEKGFNIKLVIATQNTPEGNFPNYTVMPIMPACPIPDKSALMKIHAMHELIVSRVKSYDEIRSLLYGSEAADAAPAPSPATTDEVAETPVTDADDTVTETVTPPPAPAKSVAPAAKASVAGVTPAPAVKETTNAPSPEASTASAAPASQEELVKRAKAQLAKRAAAKS